MKIKDFEKKYKSKGGIQRLTKMRSLYYSQDKIAEHFGVKKETVRVWMREFFGSNYDKRKDRRNAIIPSMIDFAKKNTKEDFAVAYKGSLCYKKALKEIKKHDIK